MSNEKEIVSRIGNLIRRQENMIKEAGFRETDLRTKVASLTGENQILRDVLGLVADGMIDPRDAAEKAAEFVEEPDQLQALKAAVAMGFNQLPAVGVPTGEEPRLDEDDPIGRVLSDHESQLRGL
jgi:hypothetical protein